MPRESQPSASLPGCDERSDLLCWDFTETAEIQRPKCLRDRRGDGHEAQRSVEIYTRDTGTGGQGMTKQISPPPSSLQAPKKTKVLERSQDQAAQGDCRLRFQLKERNGGGSNHQQTQRGQHGGVTAAAGFCWKGRSIPQPPQQQRGSSLQRRHAPASTRSQNSDKSPNGFTALKGKGKKKKRVLELNYCHLSLFC